MTAVGFEPTPFRNGALSHHLRPLGQTVVMPRTIKCLKPWEDNNMAEMRCLPFCDISRTPLVPNERMSRVIHRSAV